MKTVAFAIIFLASSGRQAAVAQDQFLGNLRTILRPGANDVNVGNLIPVRLKMLAIADGDATRKVRRATGESKSTAPQWGLWDSNGDRRSA